MDTLVPVCVVLSILLVHTSAGPQFCIRGFQLASRFHSCWEQATFSNKYPALHEPHEYLDSQFFEDYATHMCSVVKPKALDCLKENVKECSNRDKVMAIADKSGGACEGNRLNPFFKEHVVKHLVSVKSDSPCFQLADNSYECYTAVGQKFRRMGGQSDDIVTFHKVADQFFNAYWDCMVETYKSNIKVCPHWQIPMLLTLQKTAMPSLFGLRLKPEQIDKLELGNGTLTKALEDRGPSTLYLLMQLHETEPELSDEDDGSIVLELTDLNEEKPRLELKQGDLGGEDFKSPQVLSLKEIKKLMREQRRRNKEMKDFIDQAKEMAKKRGEESEDDQKKKKKAYYEEKRKKKAYYEEKKRKKAEEDRKRLHKDSMIA